MDDGNLNRPRPAFASPSPLRERGWNDEIMSLFPAQSSPPARFHCASSDLTAPTSPSLPHPSPSSYSSTNLHLTAQLHSYKPRAHVYTQEEAGGGGGRAPGSAQRRERGGGRVSIRFLLTSCHSFAGIAHIRLYHRLSCDPIASCAD